MSRENNKRAKNLIDDPPLNYIIGQKMSENDYTDEDYIVYTNNHPEPKIYESVQKALVIALNYCLITQLNTLISLYQPTRRLEGLLVVLGVLTFVTSIIETTRGRNMLIGFLLMMNFIICVNKKE